MVSRVHGIYGVELGKVSPVLLEGITAQSLRTGSEVVGEPTSGDVYPRFISLRAQNPGGNFSTQSIALGLDEIGLVGLDIASLDTFLNLFAQKHAEGGTRSAGATHRKYTIHEGMITVDTINADHQGDAVLAYNITPSYDGTNNPIVEADAQSLPAFPITADQKRFTLGPVTLESVVIEQIKTLEVNFGIVIKVEGADSDIWPTHVSIEQIQPIITMRGIDTEWLKVGNIPFTGLFLTNANTKFYLRKRALGGTFVADNVAEHIEFETQGMAVVEDIIDAAGNATGESNIIVTTNYDGTNVPLVIDTAAVIT